MLFTIMIALSSVAAFCAVPDKDTIDVSTANKLARDVFFTSWNMAPAPLPQTRSSSLALPPIPEKSMVLIAPTDPSQDSLKITITNPKFALEYVPLLFSIQRITDGVETELLQARVVRTPLSWQGSLPPSFKITIDTPFGLTIDTPFDDYYRCGPQEDAGKNAGKTFVNIDECTNAQIEQPLQFATISTSLPQNIFEWSPRLSVTVNVNKDAFPIFTFAVQEFHANKRTFVSTYSVGSKQIEDFLRKNPKPLPKSE